MRNKFTFKISIFFNAMLFLSLFFVHPTPGLAKNLTCKEGMLNTVAGTGYRATSKSGIVVTNIKTTWIGDGKYSISMIVRSNQGQKDWFYSYMGGSWGGDQVWRNLNQLMEGCLSGMVIGAKETATVAAGKGNLTYRLTPGPMGGYKGTDFVLYDERMDGFTTISSIQITHNYAVGVSKEDDAVFRQLSFTLSIESTKSLDDGLSKVSINIPIALTTTWMPANSGYDNWWRYGSSIVYNDRITIPLDVRVENNKPVDPVIKCNIPTTLNLDHGFLKPEGVNGTTAEKSIAISCNAVSNGSVEIIGDNNSSASYATVDLGKGVTSQLSVSTDKTSWARTIPSLRLINGTVNLSVKSFLSAPGSIESGTISGSAVAKIKYD